MIESAFAALPTELRERAYRDNGRGWLQLFEPPVAYLGDVIEVP
jgi:hypothetical protein